MVPQAVFNFDETTPDVTVELVDSMLIDSLREALRLRGLDTSGRKPVLKVRLKQYLLADKKSEGD